MFPTIRAIDDIRPLVAAKPEIRFHAQPNGTTVGCYMFADNHTFDSPETLECRGIAFDSEGNVCSRPLHKFFNVGETPATAPSKIAARDDLTAIFEKLDGSMIATAWVNDRLQWRSKKSFSSDVVKLVNAFFLLPENQDILDFSILVASAGYTAIFELTHPEARIVVAPNRPQMRLLHVRDNETGEYALADPKHAMHRMLNAYEVPMVPRFANMTYEQAMASLETMTGQEGYVLQFANGDMVKLKCPWYQRLHRSITFLRERDIARAALHEELDDIKAVLVEAGVDLVPVLEVETRLKDSLLAITGTIEAMVAADGHLPKKEFALKHSKHPLFGLAVSLYLGREVELADWFEKHRLKAEFGLRVLANDALADAMTG